MNRFQDKITEQVCVTRFAAGIPPPISIAAHEIMRPLLAATTLQDVGVLGSIWRWPNLPARYGLPVSGKWFVTFHWTEEFGACELRVERR